MSDDLQGTTHAEGCHTWGHRHYECALAALARKDAEIAFLNERLTRAYKRKAECNDEANSERQLRIDAESQRDNFRQRAERAEARVREGSDCIM